MPPLSIEVKFLKNAQIRNNLLTRQYSTFKEETKLRMTWLFEIKSLDTITPVIIVSGIYVSLSQLS
jgi:hypothetical protein